MAVPVNDFLMLTTEDCVTHGGHCYARTGFSRFTTPPQHAEKCKHCGKLRWAIPREPFEYIEE